MTMGVGPRGGIGYDLDTHRAGTDWNKNGSIDMGDGAMSMLVMDHVMKEEAEGPEAQPAPQGFPRSGKANSSIKEWMKRHYLLVTMIVTFVVVFTFLMICR